MARAPKPLFRLLGFPVYVPFSAGLGIALIAYINAPAFEPFGGLLPTIAYAIGLYVTVLVHELAHAIAARTTGHPVYAITLGVLGGATMFDEGATPNPKHAFSTAVVGPLTSIALGYGLMNTAAPLAEGAVAAVIGALGFMNVALGILNLLPASPLDGGHVCEAIIWRMTGSRRKGMRVTAILGGTIGAGMFGFGMTNQGSTGSLLLVFFGMLFAFEAGTLWRRSALVS